MAHGQDDAIRVSVETLFRAGTVGPKADAELLAAFREGPAAGAEAAFAALVDRHGGMVLRVCRAVLRDEHDALDAFQATFLVLVRRAKGVRVEAGGSLAPWLHGVALRTALGARRSLAVRKRHEGRHAARASTLLIHEGDCSDLRAALHAEIGRLPAPMRGAVVVCDLEGLTQEHAARRLGWPLGTLQSRLARGRARLRARLTAKGLGVAERAGAVALLKGPVVVPPPLIEGVARGAMALLGGKATPGAGAVSARAWEWSGLASGGWTMGNGKLLVAVSAAVALSSAGLTLGAVRYAGNPPPRAETARTRVPEPVPAQSPSTPQADEPGPRAELPPRLPSPEGAGLVPPTDPAKLIPVKEGDTLRVVALEALPGRPLDKVCRVRPDGTISLGHYGDLDVAGLKRTEIKVKVVERLRRFVNDEELGLIEVNAADGKYRQVPSVSTNRVFVEDQVTPAEAESARLDRLEAMIEELIGELRQGRPGRRR